MGSTALREGGPATVAGSHHAGCRYVPLELEDEPLLGASGAAVPADSSASRAALSPAS
ncbi:MAG: hypothetical protein M3P44_05645 [Actinomycetota bacterium]|nr:hypothetical protein [Actinomycetota bacterium]